MSTMRKSSRFTVAALLSSAMLLALVPGVAEAGGGSSCPQIQVVFFDLGDTLVELDVGSGLFVLRPGAAETVNQLQTLGIRLGIITNVPADWDLDDLRAVLAEPEFLDEFEAIALSSEAPAPKPDPAIYLYAHSLLTGAPPIFHDAFVTEELGHIADAEPPTAGARSVGMLGIHLSDATPSPLADYTVATDDLLAVVGLVEATGGSIFCDGFESGDTSAW